LGGFCFGFWPAWFLLAAPWFAFALALLPAFLAPRFGCCLVPAAPFLAAPALPLFWVLEVLIISSIKRIKLAAAFPEDFLINEDGSPLKSELVQERERFKVDPAVVAATTI